MSQYFIIAESLQHANSTATIDWNWQRTSSQQWIDHAGNVVRYLGSTDDLHGLRGFKIYKGYGWFRNRNVNHIERIMRQLDGEFMEPPASAQGTP